MADRIVTARRRAIALDKLRKLIPEAEAKFGVKAKPFSVPAREKDLAGVEVLEIATDLLQQVTTKGNDNERHSHRRTQRPAPQT